MAALAERLREAAVNHDVGKLAASVGVTPVTFYRWLSAKFDPGIVKLNELAKILDVSPAWLITGQGPMGRRQALFHARLEGYGPPEFLNARGSFGPPPIAFLEPWLIELLYGSTDDPVMHFGAADIMPPLLLTATDDSMEPTIKRGALVLIDRSFGIPRMTSGGESSIHDGIYAFQLERQPKDTKSAYIEHRIRRVLHTLNGRMIVRCDNSKYSDENYGIKNPPQPVGRAVWFADRI